MDQRNVPTDSIIAFSTMLHSLANNLKSMPFQRAALSRKQGIC